MARDNGGIIGPANNPTSSTASGVWDLPAQYQAISGGNWPPIPTIAENSLRFNDGSSDYLSQTQGSGNRKTFTISAWIKRSAGFGNMNLIMSNVYPGIIVRFVSTDETLQIYDSTSGFQLRTNAVYRDVSAWYHLVFAVDTTQATSSNRVKMYVNGEQITSFQVETYPSLNADTDFNNGLELNIGREAGQSNYFDGYMSEVILVDGQQLDPTSFGQFNANGIWTPIPIGISSFGTNGFRLKFENSASLGLDSSPNGNNFTVNNLTSIDQTTDTPTNNFATMNPLFYQSATAVTYSNGNCTTSSPTTGGTAPVSNIEVPKTGKWYCEIKVDSTTGSIGDNSRIGIAVPLVSNPSNPTYNARYLSNGNYNLDATGGSYGATFAAGDIIGIAVDSDSNTIEFYKNGSSQGSLSYTQQSNETYFFTACEASNTIGINYSYNFGNPPFTIASGNSDANGYGNFEYAVPSGYYALCTKNLATYG